MDKFIFGKYKDQAISEVAEDDYKYVIWAYENVKNPEHGGVSKELYEDILLDDYYEDDDYMGIDMWGN